METPAYRSGFVPVIGRTNVGKSTLINALLKQKIAAVSFRPQTTRIRQMGILTLSSPAQKAQIIFIDTPGIHHPHHKLGEFMNQEAADSLLEGDVVLLVVDITQPPQAEDCLVFGLLSNLKQKPPIILTFNKIDLVDQATLEENQQAYTPQAPHDEQVAVSATRGDHIQDLLEKILIYTPMGGPYFPEDQLTDRFERDLSADLIREAALNHLRDEVPHGIAVRIDQFTERDEHAAYIEATLFVERESHKPIVIGQGGTMLKKIGTAARKEIETMTGRKIFLQLRVKVLRNWRNNESLLKRVGFKIKKK